MVSKAFWRNVTLICFFITGSLAVVFLSSCSRANYPSETETINFAAIPSGSASLVYIAQEQGFFAENNLNVTVKDYPTGVETIGALLNGEVEVAWSAELPLVRRAFAGEKISAFAVLSRFSDEYVYGLKERGIENVTDLKGKKIGVPRNTIAEFYLVRFLELNGLSLQDVTLENVQPPQSIEAITAGSVDAVVTWDPFSTQLKNQMAGKVASWSVQNWQPGFGIITGRNDWLQEKQDTVTRFLKSLVKAQDFLIHNPEVSRNIVRVKLNFDDATMDVTWHPGEFSIFLDRSLVLAMEDEARWLLSSNQTTEKQVPDFLDYIYEDALKAIKPEAVNIIR